MYDRIQQMWTGARRAGVPAALSIALTSALPAVGGLALLGFTLPSVAHAQDDKTDKDKDKGAASSGKKPERIRPMVPGPGGLPMPIPPNGQKGGGPGGDPQGNPDDGGPGMPPPGGPPGGPDGAGPDAPNAGGPVTVPSGGGGGGAQSDAQSGATSGGVNGKHVPCVEPKTKVTMDFADAPLLDVTKYMAEITCRNFILGDDLKGSVTIISHQQVSVGEAYEAFLSALEVAGYTTVTVGKNTKVVATSKAGNAPLTVRTGDDIPGTDNFVTQIIELDNVSVNDAKDVVSQLLGPSAKVIAYAPTNTMIITDAGYNIRRAYRIVKQLDVAAPKSTLTFIHLNYATASDVQKILEQIYPSAASSTSGTSSSSSGGGQSAADRAAARRRRREGADDTAPAAGGSASTVGAEGAYVSKFISDDRTNSIIVMANDEALQKIRELIAQIDVDIDPNSRSQIHVVYLEHANASDVASVLQSLSQSGSGGSSRSSTGTSRSGTNRGGQQGGTNRSGGGGFQGGGGFPGGGGGGGFKGGPPGLPGGAGGTEGTSSSGGTAAAFDSGVRITADDNTNSLVLIAAPEDFRILKGVIDRLDIPRRQVFVEAAVVEVASDDSNTFGIGYHGGKLGDDNSLEYLSGQLGGASASLPFTVGTTGATLLSGLAAGVIGKSLEIPYTDPSTGTSTTISVPAFGIALNALASNSAVNILSDPSLLVVDNEQATITVGRTVPFPVSAGSSALTGNPVVSFQREDVGITLEVTPQINEANYVTLDVSLEVAEIEGDVTSSDPSSGGPITSKRQTENVVVVKDNQTIVIGGLISTTQTKTATKIPVLGDIPLLGVLFRGKGDTERKSNLLIFLTPHVINEPADLEEVYRVKWAQREEFLRRFYGKSRDKQEAELEQLLGGSMNFIDKPSPYRTKQPPVPSEDTIDIHPTTPTTPAAPAQAAPTTAPDAGGDDDEATPAPDGAGN